MADASVDVAEAGPHLRLADAVEALSEGFAVFDETAAMVLCNSRFRLMNPAMADLLVPGVTWEILVREAAQRGLLDAAPGAAAPLDREPAGAGRRRERGGRGAERQHRHRHALRHQRRRLRGDAARRHRAAAAGTAGPRGGELLRKVLEACPSQPVMSRVDDGEVLYRSPSAAALLGDGRNAPSHFASRDERAELHRPRCCRTAGSTGSG